MDQPVLEQAETKVDRRVHLWSDDSVASLLLASIEKVQQSVHEEACHVYAHTRITSLCEPDVDRIVQERGQEHINQAVQHRIEGTADVFNHTRIRTQVKQVPRTVQY